MSKIVHRSARGVIVDMEALRLANSEQRAIGNANMNANGDILDNKGNIVKRREQINQEYFQNNPNGVQKVSLKPKDEYFETPEEALARIKAEADAKIPDTPSNLVKGKGRKMITPKEEESE